MAVERVYYPGRWYYDVSWAEWRYSNPGFYEPAIAVKPDIRIDSQAVRQLITALDEEGWIKPRLDERIRNEDLKIIHKLLHIIEKRYR